MNFALSTKQKQLLVVALALVLILGITCCSKSEPAAEFDPMATVSADNLNVRKKPDAEAKILGRLPADLEIEILEQKNVDGTLWGRIDALTLPDGTKTMMFPARRLARIDLALDTEGLPPVADGGDLVAAVATLSDDIGTPKRYDTETIRFSVEGAADIVGENPQTTRWGEAIVLIRPRAAEKPEPIRIRAETVRRGKYAPAAGELVFTPGVADVKVVSHDSVGSANDARLRQVETQQQEFEAKD